MRTQNIFILLNVHIALVYSLIRHYPTQIFSRCQRLHLSLEDFPTEQASAVSSSLVNDIQNAAILLSGIAYIAYEKRPRGSSRDDLIEIRKSKAIANNLGVFAKKFIPEGTTIGIYPGYLKTIDEFQQSKVDEKALNNAKRYTWQLTENTLLDPTDQNGFLGLELSFLFGLFKVSTSLSRLNEPPIGYDVNAFSRNLNNDIEIVVERDIFPDDEIFIDYGLAFDRSDYERTTSATELNEEIEIARQKLELQKEKENMMVLQPVTTDSTQHTPLYDQDTSNPSGFLSKLTKQEQEKDKYSKDLGILSPEEGVKLFTEMGENMFGSAEDLELIESITGKKSSSSVASSMDALKKKKPTPPPAETTTSGLDSSEEAFLRSMMGSAFENDNRIPIPSAGSGIIKEEKQQQEEDEVGNKLTRPAISPEEAEELQSRLDNLTDEQVEKVFAKLRLSLGEKMRSEIRNNMETKSMPRAPPLNPEVREKYNKELSEMEDELEKMYSNPIGVWQDLLKSQQQEEKQKDSTDGSK
mmetsp:Transcript_1796/g.2472  ORF Transcript_1796/g.2472 Transcript_1796/m.2472 type:complete len:525 (-) Transcript_1796:984-2558(-)